MLSCYQHLPSLALKSTGLSYAALHTALVKSTWPEAECGHVPTSSFTPMTVLHCPVGGSPDRNAGIPFLPVWGLARPLRHCGPLLLRRHHLPLRPAQRVLPVKSDDSECLPDTELRVRGSHLHLCGHGYTGPPQVAGGAHNNPLLTALLVLMFILVPILTLALILMPRPVLSHV